MPAAAKSRSRPNAYIHQCYIHGEHDECLAAIDKQLKESPFCEYPIYVKALIYRKRGQIAESLTLFQSAACLNPGNTSYLKQVALSLTLLGKHKQALEVYDEALRVAQELRTAQKASEGPAQGKEVGVAAANWEVLHNKGLCLESLGRLEAAQECFEAALGAERHDATMAQLGKVHERLGNYEAALKVYRDALASSPGHAEFETSLGLVLLRLGDSAEALDHLSKALGADEKAAACCGNSRALLGWGSITQDSLERVDSALAKYRAAPERARSFQLWNNVGMCYLAKGQLVASAACLRKALYLSPLEWIVSYNLGLVHLKMGLDASAFHHLHAAVNLKPDFPASCTFLAVALTRLGDSANAKLAYEKALALDPSDHVAHLNLSAALANAGDADGARAHLADFERLFKSLDKDLDHDEELLATRAALRRKLGSVPPPTAGAKSESK